MRMQKELTDLEVRMIVTARKIRQFNEHIAKLKEMGAIGNVSESERVRDELEREFQRLSAQVRATEIAA